MLNQSHRDADDAHQVKEQHGFSAANEYDFASEHGTRAETHDHASSDERLVNGLLAVCRPPILDIEQSCKLVGRTDREADMEATEDHQDHEDADVQLVKRVIDRYLLPF